MSEKAISETKREVLDSSEENNSSKHTEHTRMIESAIRKYGEEVLVEDKTLDLIASIIRKKLDFLPMGQSRSFPTDQIKRKGGFGDFFGFIVTAISLVAGILFIYSYLPKKGGDGKQPIKLADFKFNSNGSGFVGPFEFKSGKEINFELYCGRKEEFDRFSTTIKNYLDDINTYSKKELDEDNVAVKQNFLLEGPPGTGKTIFVRYMATQIDKYLKLCYLKKNNLSEYNKVISNDKKLEEYLANAKSRVYMCEVAPGVINSKWHGESEKNINLLFKSAKVLADREFSAVFIFFDEGDTFFSTRDQNDGASEAKSSIKSELLQRIGGSAPIDKYRPIFVFCATNRIDVFDSAFKRRFGNQANFGILNSEERKEFIKFSFRNYELNEEEINTINTLAKGRPQSFISKHMSDYVVGRRGEVPGFQLRKFVLFLYNNRNNMNMA